MAKLKPAAASPVRSTSVPNVDPTKLAPAERAAFYQTQLNATKKELKSANAGLPDTPEGREIRAVIELAAEGIVSQLESINPEKTLKTLTLQIKNGKFLKVGGFTFVKSRTTSDSDGPESESKAA